MMRDTSPLRESIAASRARLDAHFTAALDCAPPELGRPGLHIVASARCRQPDRLGWARPVQAVAPAGRGACVLSCLPELAGPLQTALAGLAPDTRPFDPPWLAAVGAVAARLPGVDWSVRHIYMVDRASFRPHGVDPSVKIERWEPGRGADSWLGRAFDGPVFVVRGAAGGVAAWAGVRCASELAWEVEAVTEAAYRGRGLATRLTAAAVVHILGLGLVPICLTEWENVTAERLAERLGFTIYGDLCRASLFAGA